MSDSQNNNSAPMNVTSTSSTSPTHPTTPSKRASPSPSPILTSKSSPTINVRGCLVLGCDELGCDRAKALKYHGISTSMLEEDSYLRTSAASALSGITIYANAEDASADVPEGFEAVWVCVTPSRRMAAVEQASRLSKVVYCEAPVALNHSDVKACYELCSRRDCELLCGWTPKFDVDIKELATRVHVAGLRTATIERTVPKPQTFPEPATIFRELLCMETSIAALLADEQVPVSVSAAMQPGITSAVLEYPESKKITIQIQFTDTKDTSCISVVTNDETTSQLVKELPMRDAFDKEVAYFCDIVHGKAVARICKPEFCIVTAKTIDMTLESAKNGKPFLSGTYMRMLQIGNGKFGSYVQQSVLPKITNCETVAIATRTNSQLELDSLLARKDINAIYVCTPYDTQADLVEKALKYKKKILCEKPLLNCEYLSKVASERDQLLVIAFHRRFDTEFLKAKEFIHKKGNISSLSIESRDVSPSSDDVLEVLYSSVVNDLDLVSWLFEDFDCEIAIHSPGSSLTIVISIWLCKFDTSLEAQINYGRDFPSYRQQVSVNGKKFGYDTRDPCWYSIYNEAYCSLFEWFSKQTPRKDQGEYCKTFKRTHDLLLQAVEMVTEEQSTLVTNHLYHASASPSPQPVVMEEFEGVAGHGGMLLCGARIYKPLVTETNEWRIYNSIKEKVPELKKFIAKVYDQVQIGDVAYLVMQNLTEGYMKPRVLDLKVGEPNDIQKVPNQPYGIRVAGFSGGTLSRRAVQSYSDIVGFIKDFIKDKETGSHRYELIPAFLNRLKQLRVIFESQTEFRLRSASLLFVYDALDSEPQKPKCYLIDMGRTRENAGSIDHMFCFGLRNLCRMLDEIHKKFTNRYAIFLCRVDYEDLTWVPKATYPHDPPLSSEGIKQAEDLAQRLITENIEIIVSSPFTRALHTAKIMAEKLNVKYVVEPALAEFMSVANRKSLPALDPGLTTGPLVDSSYKKVFKDISLENWESMCERVYEAITKISRTYKRIALVSHRSTFQALLTVILGDKFKKQLQFCSITSLLPAQNDVGWAIDRLNSFSHLRRVVESPEHNPNYATAVYKDMIVGVDGKILPSGFN